MHLTGEMFELATGVKLTHVPYKGSAPAMNDLLGGSLESMFGDFLVLLPQIRAGKVRPVAVTSIRRHPMLPDVPTIAESGAAGLDRFEASSWQGLFAPAATPRDVLACFDRRWVMETTYEEARAHLGVETQRQWSDPAIFRTTPLLLGLYSLVTLYVQQNAERLALSPCRAAWYPKPKFYSSRTQLAEIAQEYGFQRAL